MPAYPGTCAFQVFYASHQNTQVPFLKGQRSFPNALVTSLLPACSAQSHTIGILPNEYNITQPFQVNTLHEHPPGKYIPASRDQLTRDNPFPFYTFQSCLPDARNLRTWQNNSPLHLTHPRICKVLFLHRTHSHPAKQRHTTMRSILLP